MEGLQIFPNEWLIVECSFDMLGLSIRKTENINHGHWNPPNGCTLTLDLIDFEISSSTATLALKAFCIQDSQDFRRSGCDIFNISTSLSILRDPKSFAYGLSDSVGRFDTTNANREDSSKLEST